MPYYCESYEISLPLSAVGTAYAAGSPSGISKAASAAFCVMFEFLEQGTYVVDVKASYVFNWNGKQKLYDNLQDIYEIVVGA